MHEQLSEKTVKAVRHSAKRIGSIVGCIAMGSCDIGEATLETGEKVYVTWGLNLDKEKQEWFAANTGFRPIWIGADDGSADVIIPHEFAKKLLNAVI